MPYALYDSDSGRLLTTMLYKSYSEAKDDIDPRLSDVLAVEIMAPAEGSDAVSFPWKCPECGKVMHHSYAALADVGSPICGDCDCEMDLATEPTAEKARNQ